MLQSYLGWRYLKHYLDNFIYVLAADLATQQQLQNKNIAYQLFTNCLGIPCQDAKDIEGTIVPVFGLEVDTNLFIVCLLADKVTRAKEATSLALQPLSLTLKEVQSLTGFLSFCA